MGAVLEDVLVYRKILPAIWDARRFLQADGASAAADVDRRLDEETKSKLNMPILTQTIKSKKWWAYAAMLKVLHSFVGHLCGWCESCACHHWLRVADHSKLGERPPNVERFEECRRILRFLRRRRWC